jgi:hypothetical protein
MATWKNGTKAESEIDLRVVVLDENDCPPVFPKSQDGSVSELSQPGKCLKLFKIVCNKMNYTKNN